jgi:parallel beta-helix repeat protein
MRILGFAYGIRLWGSSNNHINGNRISDSDSYGIEVWFSTHNDISANQITTGGCGVFLSHSNFTDMHQNNITENQAGIIVEDSSSNNIADNEVSATYPSAGLDMYSSANNSISGNSFEDCSEGVELGLSPYNVLRNNRIAGSNYSLHIYGYVLSDYLNAVDISNTVDGRPVYYWVSKHLSTVPTDAGYVALVNCTGITASNLRLARNAPGIMLVCTKDSVITSNDLTDNAYGVRLFESSNNTISYNNITANWNGISLESSDSNRIGRNNMKGNQDDGILLELSNHTSVFENNIVANGYGLNLCDSSEALIFHNNFIDNGLNVACYFSKRVPSNSLDNGYPSGGNYWSDYNGTDAHKGPLQNKVGGDGIGDTPYDVDIYYHDHYPLMKPWLRETITGDINHDGSVNIFDIVAATSIYGCRYGDPNWNPEADLASPYGRIDIYDLLTCVGHYGKKYP